MKVLLTFILLAFSLQYTLGKEIKDILLLNSYHIGYKWTNDVTNGVIDGIGDQDKYRVFVEFMDFKRFQQKDYFYELTNLFKYKYGELDFDGIICSDNYAFEFFLEKGDNIWNNNIPVSVCGVNNIEAFEFDTARFKAIKEEIDIKNTLKCLVKLQPNVDSLIIISDQTLSGKIFLNQFIDGLNKFDSTIPYKVLDGMDYKLLNNKLKKTSTSNKAIILLSLYPNTRKIPLDIKVIADELLREIEIPVYSFWDFLFGNLQVGGSVIAGYDQGFEAAKQLALRIEQPGTRVPTFTNSIHKEIFDYKVIKKYNLNSSNLPSTAIFINKEIPFWIKFKTQTIFFLTTLIVLLLVNFFLVTNIIRRKKIELQLLDSEKRLELALNSANEGLWDVLINDRKIVFNNNLAILLGYKPSDSLDINLSNWRKFIYPEHIAQVKEALLSHLRGETPLFHSEIKLYKKNNQVQYFAIHGKITERDSHDNPVRITGILMDISAQKEFESQLKIAKTRAEESDRLKSSFLANMSHEIRTPMNAILGFSDILHSDDLSSEEKEKYLCQIKNSGENLLNIINDIVDISKIESGQLTIRKEKFDLNKLLDNLEFTGNALIKSKNKKITLKIDKLNPLEEFIIDCDPFRLEQILLNLISNAIKFTQQGTVNLSYDLSEDYDLIFNVIDTGEGIAKEDQLIIFERFRQAEKSSKKLLSGTGLGLSITQSLVQLLDGNISVKSEINKGSEFTVKLPHQEHLIKKSMHI
ncbi:PAS domain S-box protein [Labilibacter sediminis]|nr:PAS domain S-box protein [Labilibacter sediminis]